MLTLGIDSSAVAASAALPEDVIAVDIRPGEGDNDRIITIEGWKGGGTHADTGD